MMCWVMAACSSRAPQIPIAVTAALDLAGDNRPELEKVIAHYSAREQDSQKLSAAFFLIANMPGKGSFQYQPTAGGAPCAYDVFQFTGIGIDSLNVLKKRYEDSAGIAEIRFTDPVFIEDIRVISAASLISNIDFAFKAWELPWARKLDFDAFCELVLPYRFAYEPLSDWREKFYTNLPWVQSRSKGNTDRLAIAAMVNDSLRKKYRYVHDVIGYFPGQLSLRQLEAAMGGRCEDLNTLLAYWLRAAGIPVASEYTSFWANSNYGGHSWVSISDTTGRFVPMNAVYDNPVRDSLPFGGAHLAKAYRKLFRLAPVPENGYSDSANLYAQDVSDVTASYLPTRNITLPILQARKSGEKIQPGVLNGTGWKPLVTATALTDTSVTFADLATNVLYAPVVKRDNKIVPVGVPFYLSKGGRIFYLTPDTTRMVDIDLLIRNIPASLYRKKCEIVYWDHQQQIWRGTGSFRYMKDDPAKLNKVRSNQRLTFGKVPANALYKVAEYNPADVVVKYGRPFLYNAEEGKYDDY